VAVEVRWKALSIDKNRVQIQKMLRRERFRENAITDMVTRTPENEHSAMRI
jgi:hypothetical protein